MPPSPPLPPVDVLARYFVDGLDGHQVKWVLHLGSHLVTGLERGQGGGQWASGQMGPLSGQPPPSRKSSSGSPTHPTLPLAQVRALCPFPLTSKMSAAQATDRMTQAHWGADSALISATGKIRTQICKAVAALEVTASATVEAAVASGSSSGGRCSSRGGSISNCGSGSSSSGNSSGGSSSSRGGSNSNRGSGNSSSSSSKGAVWECQGGNSKCVSGRQ